MTGRLGVFVDTLIRAMSIPILTGISLAFLRETGRVEVDLLPATLIYGAVVIGTLGLLVPLAYNYVGLKEDENDPVSEMRTSSAFMEWLAFFTGDARLLRLVVGHGFGGNRIADSRWFPCC